MGFLSGKKQNLHEVLTKASVGVQFPLLPVRLAATCHIFLTQLAQKEDTLAPFHAAF
jgi:hypothetical protein